MTTVRARWGTRWTGGCSPGMDSPSRRTSPSRRAAGERGMKALITGGAGFIGSHLADALTNRGHVVMVLDDLSTGSAENLQTALASGKTELVEGSILDEALVSGCVRSADVCFHLASAV